MVHKHGLLNNTSALFMTSSCAGKVVYHTQCKGVIQSMMALTQSFVMLKARCSQPDQKRNICLFVLA